MTENGNPMTIFTDLPTYFDQIFSPEQIAEANARMGRDISVWAASVWERSHTDVIAVPVLRGGIFFFADLVRQIAHSVEIAPVQSRSYDESVNSVQLEQASIDISGVAAVGRSLLLIDDICDSGKTLQRLTEAFLRAGAHEVRSAVLVKRILDKPTFDPDWIGLEYKGPEWMVGYGMEDCGRWRNLPALCRIIKS